MIFRRVVGNSMKPALFEGDVLLARKKNKVQAGDIVIAKHDGKQIIKRVKKITKNQYFLVGDNKKNSTDSRDFGAIEKEDIVAVAIFAIGTSRFTRKKPKKRKINYKFSAIAFFVCLSIGLALYGNYAKSEKESAARAKYQSQLAAKANKVTPLYKVGEVIENVPYCNGQKLDIYYPKKAVYKKAPVVMYFHGGGWKINDKASEMDQIGIIDGLRDEGFAIVSIDYRKLPESFFPAPVSDALCSVRYLRATSGTTGLDAEKTAIYGFSAGGHLAAMVGTLDSQNQFNEGPYKEQSSRVKAVVTLAGIFSFESNLRPGYYDKLQYFLNGQQINVAQPISYVTADDPPFLLVHGLQDQFVAPEQDNVFAESLKQASVKSKIIHVQNADHGLGSIGGEALPTKDDVGKMIREFIKQQVLK